MDFSYSKLQVFLEAFLRTQEYMNITNKEEDFLDLDCK